MIDPETVARIPVELARARIKKQIAELDKATSGEGTKGTMAQSAILQAVATEEAGVLVVAAADVLKETIDQQAAQLNSRLDTLSNLIDAFTKSADRGSTTLARWTIVLAFLTGFLVIAEFVQVWVSWSAGASQIVVVPVLRP